MLNHPRAVFSTNLKALIRSSGVTQADLTRELGLRQSTVSDWCSGKKYPRVDKIQLLADYFGVPRTALTEPSDASLQPGTTAWLQMGLLARGVIDQPGDLSDEQLAAILQNMDMLARAYKH